MLLYNLGVRSYALGIRLASLRDLKARQWVRGRKDWQKNLQAKLGGWKGQPRIWVHCASYGEFEQGRPVMEALRKKYPQHRILLSFFSPSGYEPFKDWKGADAVCYLPLDTKSNAKHFLDIVKPDVVLFIKYEFWLNFLKAIKTRRIPCYLVSAVFKPHHPFFRWYGDIFRKSLRTFSRLFIQDEASGYLLKNIDIHNFEVCGDTRFDRVTQISEGEISFPEIQRFKGKSGLIIAGSTWPRDEEMVLTALSRIEPDIRLIIAPHNIDERSVEDCRERLKASGHTFCVYSEGVDPGARVLLLNTMGMLSRSYYYADVAYIGGGFDSGLHNSLEPSVFGVPVTFYGNDYTRFNEAVDLLSLGAAANVKNPAELVAAWQRFFDPAQKEKIAVTLKHYFEKNRNSTGKILSYIDF
jgi:3-deoxy-D-manno-octulosonic-acid transferase